jgi:uncharacterized protein YecE (DUF72 family)
MKLYVGTSGYSYKEWKGSFYPEKLPSSEMLSYYSTRLPAVELNNTFYRMPQPAMIENWASQVPTSFRFSLKASQRITHFKRLKDVSNETQLLLELAGGLEKRLGVILFQLPPNMKKDLERFEIFLKELPASTPAAFEFRHPTWFESDVLSLLKRYKFSLCVSDTDDLPVNHIDKTATWGYLRLRRVNYSDDNLLNWIEKIKTQKWRHVFVFFKHEDEGTGPKLAARFLELAKG